MKVVTIVALLIFASKLAFGYPERGISDLDDEQLKKIVEELLDELSESETISETDLTKEESKVFRELSNLPPLLQSGQGTLNDQYSVASRRVEA